MSCRSWSIPLSIVIMTVMGSVSSAQRLKLPDLPTTLTSFGAAVADGHLYVYGGNQGGAHGYSIEAQNSRFLRLKLSSGSAWEDVGEVPRRQGNALVSHGGKIYRLGGFEAKNKEREEENYVSQTDFASYDPATGQWKDLPPLPEPRSSFDAVVMGDSIYIVGGWDMQSGDTTWHDNAWKIDLTAKSLKWEPLPQPPFKRRAHSLAHQNGKLYVIGGMAENGPTKRVEVFDPSSETWSEGPELPGEGMEGFGNSSFNIAGRIQVTTNGGLNLRLSENGEKWEEQPAIGDGRMFHRLVAIDDGRFVVVGGTSMGSGRQTTTLVGEVQK